MRPMNYRVTVQTDKTVATTPWIAATVTDDVDGLTARRELIAKIMTDAQEAGNNLWYFGEDEHGISVLVNPLAVDNLSVEVQPLQTAAPPAEAGGDVLPFSQEALAA